MSIAHPSSPAAEHILAEVGFTSIPEGWAIVRIDELLSKDRGISVGVMYPGAHDPLGVPLIKAGDLANNRINPNPEHRITKEKHHEYRRTEFSGGEILLSLVGDIGRCAIVPAHMAGWNSARATAVIRLNDPTDARFVRLCFLSSSIQHLMRAWATTTVQATLNLKEIKQIPLPWPPKSIRDRIANIVGTLDDKIELNRRMNETLEAMARRLFKSWFVDFDPVHAKAALRREHPKLSNADLSRRALPQMAPEIAELFPDGFEESTLGPIPKGWSVDSIKNRTSSIQYGFTQSSSPDPIGPQFLRITDIQGGQADWHTVPFCRATDDEIAKYRIMDGDIFVARTGASTGENIYVVEPPHAVFASYLVRFKFQHQGIARVVGAYLRSDSYFDFVAGTIGGSAQPNASAQTLAAVAIVFPSEDVATAFLALVRPNDLTRRSNDQESGSLAICRDELLPRLLSGILSTDEMEG